MGRYRSEVRNAKYARFERTERTVVKGQNKSLMKVGRVYTGDSQKVSTFMSETWFNRELIKYEIFFK